MKIRSVFGAFVLVMSAIPVAHAQDAILGEVRRFAFNFCPVGWAQTNGAMLPVAQNNALFSLLGTQYGGDGTRTFALPNIPVSTPASAPAPAAAAPNVGGEARVYGDCDLSGWNMPLGLGDYRLSDLRTPFADNGVSGVRASPGWTVTLFDGPNLDGASVTVTGEDRCLVAPRNFNDRTSSIRVTRAAPAAPAVSSAPLPSGSMCIATQGQYPQRP